MSSPATPLERRSFLGRIAAIGAALGGTLAFPSRLAAAPIAEVHPADAWLAAMKGKHKNIYDCTTAEAAPNGLFYARNFYVANTADPYKYADADLNIIVSFRHFATMFGFNDAMWAKYELGEMINVKENGGIAKKNPQTQMASDLSKRGTVVAVCGLATKFFAGQLASKGKGSADAIEAELKANLVVSTARVVAAGVVVTNRAQENGFTYNYVA